MRVLAATHDPGGANAVGAVAIELSRRGHEVSVLAKGPAPAQLDQLGLAYRTIAAEDRRTARTSTESLAPDVVVVGTSAIDELEREVTASAEAHGIPSVAIIDYWSSYRMRFERPHGGALVLPRMITAIDPSCAASMIADGLPEGRVRTLGQPYFAWLMARGGQRPTRAGAPARRVLFALQPGAEEGSALALLLQVLAGRAPAVDLAVRFHPRQSNVAELLAQLTASGLSYRVDRSLDLRATMEEQDAIVGIASALLIEATMLGVPAASIVTPGHDMLVNRGLAVRVDTANDLRAFLDAPRPVALGDTLELHRTAARRIADLCEELGAAGSGARRP